jgi:alkaline phosphatase
MREGVTRAVQRPRLLAGALSLALLAAPGLCQPRLAAQETGSVIFFHPDGMGVNTWSALRLLQVGPDGRLNWDLLPAMAVYTGHLADAVTATSNAAATIHAYGVKVPASSYGLNASEPIVARSGRSLSILLEAQEAGYAIGLVNSGTITEPGTGAFCARVEERTDHAEIARQILDTGPNVILGGGERYFLPTGVEGVHGVGARADGRDLVAEARARGYTVVHTSQELAALPGTVDRVLGLFASNHTFNARSEAGLEEAGLDPFAETAPSVAEMTRAALAILSRSERGFFLVVEEEGTDNFSNANNAYGALEAGRRADEAIAVVIEHLETDPNVLLLVTSDSDAGGLQAIGSTEQWLKRDEPVPERDLNGAPMDGSRGTATEPFLSAPDRAGNRWPFAIAWATLRDASGGILVRAAGMNADLVSGTLDSTDVYAVMYRTLFGRPPSGTDGP